MSRRRAFRILPCVTGFVGQPGLAQSTWGKLQGVLQADKDGFPTPFLGCHLSKHQPVCVQERIPEHNSAVVPSSTHLGGDLCV